MPAGPQGFGLVGPIEGPDHIEATTTMPLPGEPRCCPTGTARWSMERAGLAVTRVR